MKGYMSLMLAVCCWLTTVPVAAQSTEMMLTLQDMETKALAYSPQYKAKLREVEAVQCQANAQKALLWPKLSLEGKLNYIAEIPEITLELPIPMAAPMTLSMGDNINYSAGLQLGWQVWDGSAIRSSAAAMEKTAQAKQQELVAVQQAVKLKTRLAYFRTQLALEQVAALVESVKLAIAQNVDIKARAMVGSSSRIDSLSSRMDVGERKKQLREARTQLALALRELMQLTGQESEKDLMLPLGVGRVFELPADIAPATVRIKLDPMNDCEKKLALKESPFLSEQNATIQNLEWMVRAADDRARSAAAGYWPWVTVYGKSSWDYPNQLVKEEVWQNTAGVALSWTLWQAGRTNAMVQTEENQKAAVQESRNQLYDELLLTWQQAKDRIGELQDVQQLNEQQLKDAEALASLVYEAYRTGRVNYLEVQSANLRVLQARTQKAVTKTQTLIQLALLDSLQAEGETNETQK